MTTERKGETRDDRFALLLRALETGYFEVPRRTTLVELADERDMTSREASKRIRRELDEVLEECLDGG